MSYIISGIEEFFSKLDKMQRELAVFSQSLDDRSSKIPVLLKNFENAVFSSVDVNTANSKNAVEKAAQKSLDNLRAVVETWGEKIEAERKGREFIRKNEKYLVVMVFGAVKAGKSSLGNFFAGKKFLTAPFDNPYKHIEKPIFETEERGRDTGDVEKDTSGNTWFSEGVTDTTGAIQYFTLSGLRWVDSPGTGAVSKEGDTLDMTKLVEEYLSYTDMCIFLMNSSEPGLQDDMRYMQKLSKEGQEALIVITKSDFQDEDVDDDGEIVSVTCPKTDEIRKMQEDNICARVKERYPDIDADRFRALSISTLLANEAIKEENDEKYKKSNIDKLMKILGNKVSDNAVERKQANPRRLLNNFVDSVISGLSEFENDLNAMKKEIEKYKAEMDSLAQIIVANVKRNVKTEVMQQSYEWNRQVKGGKNVDSDGVNNSISQILQAKLNEEINSQMKRIIEDYEGKEMSTIKASLSVGDLTKKTVTTSHTYTESYTVRRSPDGIIEHIRSFFGKEFYRTEHRTRTEHQTIDMGTNLDEFLESLMPQVEKYAQTEAKTSLEDLRENYFAKREIFAANMKKEIDVLRSSLVALKF